MEIRLENISQVLRHAGKARALIGEPFSEQPRSLLGTAATMLDQVRQQLFGVPLGIDFYWLAWKPQNIR